MYIYQRENGTWYIALPNGRRKSLKTRDRRMAEQKLLAHRRVALRGEIHLLNGRIKSGLLLSDLLQRYIEIKPLADATRACYRSAVSKFSDFVGNISIGRIDEECLQKFAKCIKARGANEVSTNTYLRHLKVLFNYARAKKWIDELPEFPKEKEPRRHPRILSKDEISLLLDYSFNFDFEMHRYIKFALYTGCRRNEIRMLTWDRVFDTYCKVIGKGDRERTVPLVFEAKAVIGAHGGQPGEKAPVFYPYLDIDIITKKFKRIARECKIDDVHFHNLRHTAATLMLASGIDIYYVKQMLGHTDLKTTEIYATVLRERLTEELQKFKI